jgi:hypothetical protein
VPDLERGGQRTLRVRVIDWQNVANNDFLCVSYCLDEYPDAIAIVAADWRSRRDDPLIVAAIEILQTKFQTVDHYGPQQLAIFHESGSPDEGPMHSRRAFELVQKLLSLL